MAEEKAFVGSSGTPWRWFPDRPLGEPGTFGSVFEGVGDEGQYVAVKKVLRAQPGREPLDERLLRREAEIGRRVQELGANALALPVVDVAEEDDAFFFVMERAEGALAGVALPLREADAIAVLMDIATGLQQLHSIGVIHRDLKPANILRHEGRWKLADFGIAHDAEIGTQSATFVGWGSAPYMAPELWKLQSPTAKTDLYALGCLAYQMLAGQPPYSGNRDSLRTAHLQEPVPEAPTDNTLLRSLIARLLAKDSGERPQDARAVVERLDRARLPRTPQQEAIARGLAIHQQEQSAEAIARSEAEAQAEARQRLVAQARVDLDEVFQDALLELQGVRPDARYHSGQIGLELDEARLRVELWHPGVSPVPRDSMVEAGALTMTNRRRSKPFLAANAVYELGGDGRWAWHVYRFRAGIVGHPANYRYGPFDRPHGLPRQIFLDRTERGRMVEFPGLHAWSKKLEVLEPDVLLRLFQEAVDLPAKVSQDPRW